MRSLTSVLLAASGLLFLCATGATEASASVPSAPSKSEASPVVPVLHIAPHRAVYKMKLSSAKNGSNVSDVSGRMLFEWRDVCDGWAIQQHMQLHFSYGDGNEEDITSTELTWESKDGKKYNFNIHRQTDGQETDNFSGKATQNANGTVSVVYTNPEGKTAELPAGTLFPTAHTELILGSAAKGDKFFTRRVFDGADQDGSSDISAFVSPQRDSREPKLKVKKSSLLQGAPWPVHLAFFKAGSETGEPDYEMDLALYNNGIARNIKIDYGEFSVVGTLENIDALQTQNCP